MDAKHISLMTTGRRELGGEAPATRLTAEDYRAAARKARADAIGLPENMRRQWLRAADHYEAIAAELDG
jgi:hypothetical protein